MGIGTDSFDNLAVFEPANIVTLDFDYVAAFTDAYGLMNAKED